MLDLADAPALAVLLNDLGRGVAALVIFLAGVYVLVRIHHLLAMNLLAQEERRLELDERRRSSQGCSRVDEKPGS